MGLKPISEIKANLGIEPNGRVQKFFTNTCRNHMDKYVPKDTGILRENVVIENDSITLDSKQKRINDRRPKHERFQRMGWV